MEIEIDLFAGIAVTDYERAVEWYQRLFGSPPSMRPHDTESVWDVGEHEHVYVVRRPEHAGHSLVTLFVGDLEAFVDGAEHRGIEPESRETYDNGVRKIIFRDPEGNELGCAGAPIED